jgi:hypothetical protein
MGDAAMVCVLLEGGVVAEGRALIQSAVAAENTEVRSCGSLASSNHLRAIMLCFVRVV